MPIIPPISITGVIIFKCIADNETNSELFEWIINCSIGSANINIRTATFIFFAILAVLIFIFAEPILQFIIHSNNTELVSLSAMHLKIMTQIPHLASLQTQL